MAMRFHTYAVGLSAPASEYVETLLGNKAVQQWRAAARIEPEQLPAYEVGTAIRP